MMKRWRPALLVLLLCLVGGGPAAAAAGVRAKAKKTRASKPGRKVLLKSGCTACHSVSSKGIDKTTPKVVKGGPDLARIGRRWKAKRLRAWLRKDLVRKGRKHPFKFKGGRAQLNSLVSWLLRLR